MEDKNNLTESLQEKVGTTATNWENEVIQKKNNDASIQALYSAYLEKQNYLNFMFAQYVTLIMYNEENLNGEPEEIEDIPE